MMVFAAFLHGSAGCGACTSQQRPFDIFKQIDTDPSDGTISYKESFCMTPQEGCGCDALLEGVE